MILIYSLIATLNTLCVFHGIGKTTNYNSVKLSTQATVYRYLNAQCPYLLKFVDIVLDVEVTTDLIIKLRIRRMVFTKPLVDIHVKYELLSLR